MGKSLAYCYKFSKLIREEEFAKGKAFNLGDRVSCADCACEVGVIDDVRFYKRTLADEEIRFLRSWMTPRPLTSASEGSR